MTPLNTGGWSGKNGCSGCEQDVDNVQRVLAPLGFDFGILKTSDATAQSILNALRGAALSLGQDDLFVFYYSGHGGQQPDFDGDENDGKDETLVAYDREVNDDEINAIWPLFRSGTRIVMLSDSCNSGSNYRMRRDVRFNKSSPIKLATAAGKQNGNPTISAQMIHYGGCRDGSTSAGYEVGGAFTTGLCRAWQNGSFKGNYRDLYSRILDEVKDETQQPQFSEYGSVTDLFRNQRPFTIPDPSKTGVLTLIPTCEEVSTGMAQLPLAWLHQPTLASHASSESAKIAPLAAAAIGVAVGAGIQLGSQALNKAVGSRPTPVAEDFRCDLSYSTIEQISCTLVNLAQMDPDMASCLHQIAESNSARLLPVAAAAFLAGVAAGAAAARK